MTQNAIQVNEVKRPWWYRTIRGMNLYAYRRWWLIWALFFLALFLFFLFCSSCCDRGKSGDLVLQNRLNYLDSVLNDCDCGDKGVNIPDTISTAPVGPPNTSACNQLVKSGGQGLTSTEVYLGSTPGRVVINYNMYDIPDQIDIYYGGKLVHSTNRLVNNIGSLTWDFPADPSIGYSCVVVVHAPNNGTAWDYTVSCPQ
jgi:hypothetical protein